MTKNYNPVIVFAFSKRECEALALTLSKYEFNTTEEQDMIANIFTNAMDNLSPDDRQLPQISNLLPLLKRGIGIHHGGLLPILKEVIEILFQEGLIKVLFATETFSIGLNMPAKTVVFVAARKFDGRDFRNLSSGEYIQMSGRAGRRGLDDRGVVIMMCDEKLEPTSAKEMIKGEADRLDSAFHLGYNMILNLMKVEGISPEFMLERCFYQFQNNAEVPLIEDSEYDPSPFVPISSNLRAELQKEEAMKGAIAVPDEELVASYYEYRQQLDQMAADFREVITHPNYSLPFLQAGRLVKIKYEKLDFGWGVIIDYQKRLPPKVSALTLNSHARQSLTCRRIARVRRSKISQRTSSTSLTYCYTALKVQLYQRTATCPLQPPVVSNHVSLDEVVSLSLSQSCCRPWIRSVAFAFSCRRTCALWISATTHGRVFSKCRAASPTESHCSILSRI